MLKPQTHLVAPGCKLKHKRSSNINFVHLERSGLDLRFDIHCSIGAVDLHGSVLDLVWQCEMPWLKEECHDDATGMESKF